MKALRFERTGSLNELKIEEIPRPEPAPGNVLVEVKAAALNPSDVKNVLGRMKPISFDRDGFDSTLFSRDRPHFEGVATVFRMRGFRTCEGSRAGRF
jgi:hypothetical protein